MSSVSGVLEEDGLADARVGWPPPPPVGTSGRVVVFAVSVGVDDEGDGGV